MRNQTENNKYFQVKGVTPWIVRTRIKQAVEAAVNRRLEIAPRETPNLIYVSGRVCMKSFDKLKVCKASDDKCYQILGLLEILLDLNENEKFLSKQQIFNKNQQLFQTQTQCDVLIDDVCYLLGVTQRCLRIEESPNGMVIGSIVIRQNGQILNLQYFNNIRNIISPCMSDFDIVSCDANFILVVEKETTFLSLIKDNFHRKLRCIMITGRGMPDVATRYFLRSLTNKLNNLLPVLALVDYDPNGIEIMCTYTCGSDSLAFDSESLVTPGIKWLGVRPTDWETYNVDLNSGTTELSPEEKLALEAMMEKDFLMDKTSWVNEISNMMKAKRTYNLEAISSKTVLRKLVNKDWLP